jgi:hypothetical protein
MGINEMSHPRIATNQNKLLKCEASATGFENPEQTLDRYIHDLIRYLFAGGQMDDMRHAIHDFIYNRAVFDGAMDILYPFLGIQFTVVTQRPNGE